jgi:Cys-rich protein (TIGR01571 family)
MVEFAQETSGSEPFLWTREEWNEEMERTSVTPLPASMQDDRIQIPTGRWKDGLCDCFSVGICHPSLLCAWCCRNISLAQIMTRMSLTWLGEDGQKKATQNTFKVMVLLFVSYTLFLTSLGIASSGFPPGEAPLFIVFMKMVGSILYGIWFLYSLCRTRQNVRAQYSIPEESCAGCEDFCCAFFCACCTLSQMARHTGEYETYPGTWCSTTGHPPDTPLTYLRV